MTETKLEAGKVPGPEAERAIRPPQLSRKSMRAMLYVALALCDIAAIRAGFSIGVSLKGLRWLSPNGVELGWLILPLHLLLGMRRGAFSLAAVTSRFESMRMAVSAFILATGLISMLIFFQYAGSLVSRLAFGVSIVLSLVFLVVFRFLFLTLFVPRTGKWTLGELLILDGVPIPAGFSGEILYPAREKIEPSTQDPAQFDRLAQRIARYDRVIVASASNERRHQWARMMKAFDVTAEVLLDEGSPLGAIGIGRFLGGDTVVVTRGPLSLGNRIAKRAMDLAISIALLGFLAPLLILVAVAIKLDSRGPALFRQPRVGRDNRLFRIYKFRSMVWDQADHSGDRSTARDDDRITRVGRFIRMTSIDELPQLLNVLKGDMSMVGPRPHALGSRAGEKLFWQVDETYWRRHQLKPGITGLAQVRGYRGSTSKEADLENRLQSDLEYISGWSIWRDVYILLATVRVVIHPHAY